MSRIPFICGNWKMYKSKSETLDFFKILIRETKDIRNRDILIAPVFIYLDAAIRETSGSKILVSSQDVFFKNEGAYTGEISPLQLKDINCSWTLIGHSERRKYFCETDENVNLKIRAVLPASINPIVCIGETAEERKAERTFDVISRQLKNAFHMIEKDQAGFITVAYEPVWAIGTGLTATPEMAQDAHRFIRETVNSIYGKEISDNMRILYGGSVKSSNIKGLMDMPDIDGVLVGGASLKIDEFLKIIKFDQ